MSGLKISITILFTVLFITVFGGAKRMETGIASYYHDCFKGRRTANGEKYSPSELTAAHLKLPFNTLVKVTNLKNEKFVVVRINDRGPFVDNRIIDLSKAAADSLGILKDGLVKVEIRVLNFDTEIDSVSKPFFAGLFPKNIFKKEPLPSIKHLPKELKVDTFELNNSNNFVYGIQIGSFKNRSNMLTLSERLRDNYIEKFNVQEIEKGDAIFYRMILGEFTDRKQAEILKSKILSEFPNCFIVKYYQRE